MKLLKNSSLGTAFLLSVGSATFASSYTSENIVEAFECSPFTLTCGIQGVACDFDDTEALMNEIRSIDEDLCTD
ncbi:MAG: hypothetical protein R6V36_12160 [Psychroflexus sp.]